MTSRSNARAALLCILVFAVSAFSPVPISYDSRWTVYTAMSLWKHGDVNLDEYADVIVRNDYYQVVCVEEGKARVGLHEPCKGHWYDWYPAAVPILTAPLIGVAVAGMNALHPFVGGLHSSFAMVDGFFRADFDAAHAVIEQVVASVLLALSAWLVILIARRYVEEKHALMLAALFAFGTSAYSTAGRGLWQHGPAMLLLLIAVYLLDNPSTVARAGLPAALAYTVRPTAFVAVIVFTAFVAVKHRTKLPAFLAWAAPVAIGFFLLSRSMFGAWLPPYFQPGSQGYGPIEVLVFFEALAGNLISPSRGLLIFTPVFALALFAWKKWQSPLAPWIAAWAGMHWLLVSSFTRAWWAGASYGPRFFTELSPFLVLMLIPLLRMKGAIRTLALVAALWGVGVHLRGGWSTAVYNWNATPSVDDHPEHVWDWRDPQWLR